MGFIKRNLSPSLLAIITIIAASIFGYQGVNDRNTRTTLSYSEYREYVERGDVAQAKIKENKITGKLAGGEAYRTTVPVEKMGDILEQLEQSGAVITAEEAGDQKWIKILVGWGITLLFLGVGGFVVLRMSQVQSSGSQAFQMGKSNDTMLKEERPDTTFEDVGGYNGPKKEVEQIIDYLKNPDKFARLGGQMPTGLLMKGPPGTGKTLMGRAIAGEAGVPFLHVSGSDFIEMYVGVGASRVRDLFDKAEKNAPAIVFIDELDSVGRKRGSGLGKSNDEREQTLNQLLERMDGFEEENGVIIIGATNRPDVLDPALMRPGRFDREVEFSLPSVNEREEILQLHAKDKPLADEVNLRDIAHSSIGMSGADLENLLNEAAIFAAEEEAEEITQDHLDKASDKIVMGRRRDELDIDEEERKTLAAHEAGHAICAHACQEADDVHKITIIPRGQALGATQQQPETERHIHGKSAIQDRITVMLGGRAAEQFINSEVSSGAEDDIEQATNMAKRMVLKWGMDEEVGPVALEDRNNNSLLGNEVGDVSGHSEDTKKRVDKAVRGIITGAQKRALAVIEEHNDEFNKLIDELLKHETLRADQVSNILEGVEA